jgi:phosphatidylinositol glycan class C protein
MEQMYSLLMTKINKSIYSLSLFIISFAMEDGKWTRQLWRKQPFPDNYVDDSFLDSLVVSRASVQSSSNLKELVIDSLVVSQQISVVIVFLLVFSSIYHESLLSGSLLVWLDLFLLPLGICICHYLQPTPITLHEILHVLERTLLFIAVLLALSPVLKTLTSAYSTDTIIALTFVLCSLHLLLHDYSYVSASRLTIFQGSFSLNAAILASILLASRLSSNFHVFSFVLFSFEVFAGVPVIAKLVKVIYMISVFLIFRVIPFIYIL